MTSTTPCWTDVKADCQRRAQGLFPVYDIGPPTDAYYTTFPLIQKERRVGMLTIGVVIASGAESTVSHAQLALATTNYAKSGIAVKEVNRTERKAVPAALDRGMNAICLVGTIRQELEGKRVRARTVHVTSLADRQQHLLDSHLLAPVLGLALGATPAQAWYLLPVEQYVGSPALQAAHDPLQSLDDLLEESARLRIGIAPVTLDQRLAWAHELLRTLRFLLTYLVVWGDLKLANVMISS
jgi:hypothetical protein